MKNRTNLYENDYIIEEEAKIYDILLEEVYNNPRYYLDNLDSLTTFRVRWHNYSTNSPALPYKHIRKAKLYKGDAHSI
ncbi:hypothetical protein DRN75_03980 [Nanoarchaeota archaeon]|nr:MAG: hypothetical protein DRN75_03980 [Nanoarchaeota archaeon]